MLIKQLIDIKLMYRLNTNTTHVNIRLKTKVQNISHINKVTFFMDFLDLHYNEAEKIILKNKHLKDSNILSMQQLADALLKLGISKEQILSYPEIWKIQPVMAENHGMILQECGFKKIDSKLLLRYIPIIKKRISLLKLHGYIPETYNYQENLYSYLEPPPSDTSPLPDYDEEQSVHEEFLSILKHYLFWKLKFENNEQMEYVFKTYYRIRHKSLRNTKRSIDLLLNEIGFTEEKVRNNGYLLYSHPENTIQMLRDVKTIAGVDLRTVLYKHPKILMSNNNTLKAILQILKEHNINDDAISKCASILTLSSNSVSNRLQEINRIPEFQALSKNPRSLRLVYYQNNAKSRLSHLQQLKMKNASLNILSTTNELFEKYVRDGVDRTRGDDLIKMLEEKIKHPTDQLRIRLSQHSFWYHVPIVTVKETVEYLLHEKYTNDQIFDAIHIVLYPKTIVQSLLLSLRTRKELARRWISPVQQLNLCVYYIEQPHHFSGDGIWNRSEFENAEIVAGKNS